MICSIEECEKPRKTRLYCWMHDARVKRHGDPLTVLGPWKDDPGYAAIHLRLVKERGKPSLYQCVGCQDRLAQEWAYDHKDPDEKIGTVNRTKTAPYSMDLMHYEPLCIRCHRQEDYGHTRLSSK